MTTTEWVLVSVIVILVASSLLFALMFFRALARALEFADRVHIRGQQFQDNLLDRLMAVEFETFKSYQAAEQAPPGGWEPPETITPEDYDEAIEEAQERGETVSLTGLRYGDSG